MTEVVGGTYHGGRDRIRSPQQIAALPDTKLRPRPEGAECPLEAGHVAWIGPDPVDLPRGGGDERDRVRADENGLGETLALATRGALRVVQFLETLPARAGGEPL